MVRAAAIVIALLGLCPFAPADDKQPGDPPAERVLADGLARAKKENKTLCLVFGSPNCEWSPYLDKYHADAEVRKVIEPHLVIARVDVVKNPGGQALYEKYGGERGVPAFSFLNADAKVLSDSGDDDTNVGFPYEPEEIDRYRKALKTACPKLSDSDLDVLTKRLKEIAPKKK